MSDSPAFTVPGTGDPFKDAYTRHELLRAARHTRQGVEAAVRIFGSIVATTPRGDALATKVAEALTRVETGPAPVAFKTAFDTSITDLLKAAQ